MMQELAPEIPIHVSTQANNINYRSAIKWYKMGATRVVLAREMSFKEIAEFQKKIPEDLELEAYTRRYVYIVFWQMSFVKLYDGT